MWTAKLWPSRCGSPFSSGSSKTHRGALLDAARRGLENGGSGGYTGLGDAMIRFLWVLPVLALAAAQPCLAANAKGGSFGTKSTSSGSTVRSSSPVAAPQRKNNKLFTFTSRAEMDIVKGRSQTVTSGGTGDAKTSAGRDKTSGSDPDVPTGFGRPLQAKRPSRLKPLPR